LGVEPEGEIETELETELEVEDDDGVLVVGCVSCCSSASSFRGVELDRAHGSKLRGTAHGRAVKVDEDDEAEVEVEADREMSMWFLDGRSLTD